MKPFLTARWQNLILAQYAAPAELLRLYLPPGVELDAWEGRHFVSLVGFQFLDTRVLGVPWPTFRNFPEWNLRIYVRYRGQRGVAFVREFVPQWFVATVARLIYNEPYRSGPMRMTVTDEADRLTAAYDLTWAGRTHTMRAVGAKPPMRPGPDSPEHFFKEHAWGFGQTHRGKLLRYEVRHPEWDVYPAAEFVGDFDCGLLYGEPWRFLNEAKPHSVFLAAGSEVAVYPHGTMLSEPNPSEPERL